MFIFQVQKKITLNELTKILPDVKKEDITTPILVVKLERDNSALTLNLNYSKYSNQGIEILNNGIAYLEQTRAITKDQADAYRNRINSADLTEQSKINNELYSKYKNQGFSTYYDAFTKWYDDYVKSIGGSADQKGQTGGRGTNILTAMEQQKTLSEEKEKTQNREKEKFV